MSRFVAPPNPFKNLENTLPVFLKGCISDTLLLFEGFYEHCVFPETLRVKFTSVDVLTLCFSEKLPAADNLAFIFRGQSHYLK